MEIIYKSLQFNNKNFFPNTLTNSEFFLRTTMKFFAKLNRNEQKVENVLNGNKNKEDKIN